MIGLDDQDLAIAIRHVWRRLLEGMHDDDVAEELGIADPDDWEDLRGRALEHGQAQLKDRSSEQQYVGYMVQQMRCVRDLDELVRTHLTVTNQETGNTTVKNAAAYVSAVKARSDIFDRIVKMGQETGMLRQVGDSLVPGVAVEDLSSDQLRRAIKQELADLDKLTGRCGNGNLLELDPGPLHIGQASVTVNDRKKESVAQVSDRGGRRVVRAKKRNQEV